MTKVDELEVEIKGNAKPLKDELDRIERLTKGFATNITNALERAVLKGGKLSDVLRSLAQDLSRIGLNAALDPLKDKINSTLSSGISTIFGAIGGLFGLPPTRFAKGGVVSGPSLFPLAGGRLGLAGESGAEAILPLSRGSDGRLGVRLDGGRPAVNVTFNIATPDAASFRRSESQISAMVSRALARGERNL